MPSSPGNSTGSFWLCPSCRKHVPSRSLKCICGQERGAESIQQARRSVPPIEQAPIERSGMGALWTIGFGLACAGAVVFAAMQLMKPAPDAPKLKLRAAASPVQQPPPQPQFLIVEREKAPEASAPEAPPDPPVQLQASMPTAAPKSEQDQQRELALSIYRPRMMAVADSAVQVKMLQRRYWQACEGDTVTERQIDRRGVAVGSGQGTTTGRTRTDYVDANGQPIAGSRSTGQADTTWRDTQAWAERQKETLRMRNSTTTECQMTLADIDSHGARVKAAMEMADREAAEKRVWNSMQQLVVNDLEQELWQ